MPEAVRKREFMADEELRRRVRGKRRKKKELTSEEEIMLAEMQEEARQKAYKIQSDWVRDRCKQYNLRFNIGKARDAEIINWLENELEEYGVLDELSKATGRTYSSGKKGTKDALGRTLSVYNNGKMEYIKQTIYADMKRRKKKAEKEAAKKK